MKSKNKIKEPVKLISLNKFCEYDKSFNDQNQKFKSDQVPAISYISLFRFATTLDKFFIILGLFCCVLTSLTMPFSNLLMEPLINAVLDYITIIESKKFNETTYADQSLKLVNSAIQYCIFTMFCGVLDIILTYISTIAFNYSAFRQILRIRRELFKSLLNQDISWYEVNVTGNFVNLMSEDLIKLEEGLGEKISVFFHCLNRFFVFLIISFIKGWELTLICLISLPIVIFIIGFITKISSKFIIKELAAYNMAGKIAEEVFSSIKTVVAFSGQKKEITRYRDKLVYVRNINKRKGLFLGLGFGFLWFFNYISYAFGFWYGVDLVLKDRNKTTNITYNAGSMITIFINILLATFNFGVSISNIEVFQSAVKAGAKVFKVISNPSSINKSKFEGIIPTSINGQIHFKNVQFHYPSRANVPVLRNFTLTINPGETIALVGSSGCGKSTCIQLIQRFYDPINGIICFDNIDIKALNLAWFRRNIGVVSQEPILFDTSIADNIRYGNYDASQQEIEQAAKISNAHDFIVNLPQGYDTLVGEHGAHLSGGQKQRIAIARAIVRNPVILLLDEATSALDMENETKVQIALEQARKKRTTIIVTHRLSNIRNVDKIIVLSDGRIVEQGHHNELMILQGVYYKLIKAQYDDNGLDLSLDECVSKTKLMKVNSFNSNNENVNNSTNIDLTKSAELNYGSSITWWQVLKLNAPEKMYIIFGCVASLIIGITNPLYGLLLANIYSIFSISSEKDIKEQSNKLCLFFLLLGVAKAVASFFEIWLFSIAGDKLTNRLREKMFETMVTQDISWFDKKENGTGSLCSRLSIDAANVQGATGQRVGVIINSCCTIVTAISLSVYFDYKITAIAVSFVPFIIICSYFNSKLSYRINSNNQKKIEKTNNFALEAIVNIRTVASLGCENVFYNIYTSELMFALKTTIKELHVRAIIFGLARGLSSIAFSMCIYYMSVVIQEDLTAYSNAMIVTFIMILNLTPIINTLLFAPNFQKGLQSAANIFKLLHNKPIIESTSITQNSNLKDWNIFYHNVHFSYPTRQELPILKAFNLSIPQNKTIALVGLSGCGKSTVIHLLERFYNPILGDININNNNIQNIDLKELRSNMSIVSQESSLFDQTIAENIAYGDSSKQVSKNEIIAAALQANIHNFIISLPMGYDTKLGKKGVQLSGGQKQRIAIARALIRNPKVLLLDEATSALDSESEKMVQDALDKAKKDRTCIMITHRLSTIQDADTIFVMNKGKIVESGTHTELLNNRGLYFNLYSLQNM